MSTERNIGRAVYMEGRRRGIGGTDAAAILGLSKWATPLTVWLDKRGERPPDVETEPKLWGKWLEPLIGRRYSEKTGLELWKPSTVVCHPEHSEIVGSLDFVVEGRALGVEAKTARSGEEWGEAGTDEVPAAYLVQVQHYMLVTGFPRWDVAALISGSDFRIYHVEADRQFQAEILDTMREWWRRHVIEGQRPRLDGSEETARWLAHRFPNARGPIARAPVEVNSIADRVRRARVAYEQIAEEKAAAEHALKEAIGEHSGLEGEGWRATWNDVKARRQVDWEAVARGLVQAAGGLDAILAELAQKHTTEGRAYRRFVFRSTLAAGVEDGAGAEAEGVRA